MMRRVVIFSNLRMLLIFLLLNKEKLENIIFISEDKTKLSIIKSIYFRLEKNNLKRVLNLFLDYLKLKKIFVKLNKFDIKVYGADHMRVSQFFVKRYDFYLIEDGTINYLEASYKRSVKNRIFSRPKFGMDKNIKKIYLTGLAPIPQKIKNKVEIINLKQLWNLKDTKEQQEILEIFGFNNKIIEGIKERNIILYTQPLSEDGIISEKEKIELYSKVILNYPKNKMILKTHPRERTNYRQIFKEILILDQTFPSEIFELLEISFKRCVTLFSTSVLNTKSEEIDFYGTEIHNKLFKKFGSMDHVIKRNKFL